MSTGSSPYVNPFAATTSAAAAAPAARAGFIRNTYLHLAGAILAFVGLEALLIMSPLAPAIAGPMLNTWWLVLVLFIGVSWLADKWARSDTSQGVQYLGLGLFIVAEAVIFLPILYLLVATSSVDVIEKAGFFTLLLFAGLTAVAFTTRTDFSFLRGALTIAGFAALGLIGASFIFDSLNLGTWFSFAMIAVAGASILYSTSNILRHYRTDQHVAAALALFSSIALMFWYLLRIFMNRD
jgi:FtsH-binding integral membrane protein